jgi:hypothetical protein
VTADAGEDVEKEKISSIASGVASLYNHSGGQSGGSSENWTQFNIWKSITLICYINKFKDKTA